MQWVGCKVAVRPLAHLFILQHQGLLAELPDNVHLLTVEHLEQSKMLLRLENQFQADEPVASGLDANATIDIRVSELCQMAANLLGLR